MPRDLLVHNFIYDFGNLYTNISHHQGYPVVRAWDYVYIKATKATKSCRSPPTSAPDAITFHRITLGMKCHFFSSLSAFCPCR